MKKEIGFVCVGQAGGNIGILFEKSGFDVFYINTSREDLDSIKGAVHKYHIKDGEGCNKDRDKAKAILAENIDELLQEIKNKIPEKIVFVIFAAGGGTGSGTSPFLIDILRQETDRKVGCITILPAEGDSFKAQVNAFEAIRELSEIESSNNTAATFFLDNNKGKDKLKINRDFHELFLNFLNIPSKCISMKGNIDKAEVKTVLSTPGMSILHQVPNKRAEESYEAKLMEAFHNTIFASMEKDKIVRYLSLAIPENGTVDVKKLKTEVGMSMDEFLGYGSDSLICSLSGLSYPFTRLEELKTKVMGCRQEITKSLKASNAGKLSLDTSFLEMGDKQELPGKSSQNTSSRDLLRKYIKK